VYECKPLPPPPMAPTPPPPRAIPAGVAAPARYPALTDRLAE